MVVMFVGGWVDRWLVGWCTANGIGPRDIYLLVFIECVAGSWLERISAVMLVTSFPTLPTIIIIIILHSVDMAESVLLYGNNSES